MSTRRLKRGALVGGGVRKNTVFGAGMSEGAYATIAPYILLRQELLARGLQLDTADVLMREGVEADFEIHLNVQRRVSHPRSYVLLFETPLVRPRNGDIDFLSHYRKVLTWRTDWIDGVRYIPFAFPNTVVMPEVDGLTMRDRFACMIAGNKAMPRDDGRSLYGERVLAVRWFEHNRPDDFDLWGPGWNRPPARAGIGGRLQMWTEDLQARIAGTPNFPSWRGLAVSKREVMRRTRFAICYENVRDFPGYITEKIFDCLFAGCVPVYWGAAEIAKIIPRECYVDRRNFGSYEDLHAYLAAVSDAEYRASQSAMREFLASDGMHPFTAEQFAVTVATAVAADLL